MPNFKSSQVTTLDAGEKLTTKDAYGRVRRAVFTFTTPTGGVAIHDTVELCRVPSGARIMGGHFAAEAMSSGGAAASMQLGDGTTADRFLGTTSIDAAAEGSFGDTIATGFLDVLSGELTLTATALTEAWAAGQHLSGYLEYVVD